MGIDKTAQNAARISTFFITNLPIEIEKARLIRLAEIYYSTRQISAAGRVGRALMDGPFDRETRALGLYYVGLSVRGLGKGNLIESTRLLERAASDLPAWFRARVMIGIAANLGDQGDPTTAAKLYLAAGRSPDAWSRLAAHKMIAVYKSREGDHAAALSDLEALVPLAWIAATQRPDAWWDMANSIAVESLALGQYRRALSLSARAASSSFAPYIPQWQETHDAAASYISRVPVLWFPPSFPDSASIAGPRHSAFVTVPAGDKPTRKQKERELLSLLAIRSKVGSSVTRRLRLIIDPSFHEECAGLIMSCGHRLDEDQMARAKKLLRSPVIADVEMCLD
jgi:hypothetical protein